MPTQGKRKAISKKLRFEVFKRDSFKCQYCGNTAPDIVLVVDHIKPVKEGGTNELTNLIAACNDCNSGKGARKLDDNSVIKKQQKQLEELNERREQLEMMMEWRNGLKNIDEKETSLVVDYYRKQTDFDLKDQGVIKLKKYIKKYGLNLVLDSIDDAVQGYAVYDSDCNITFHSAEKLFSMIPKICHMKMVEKEKPYIKELLYIRGIIKNRLRFPERLYGEPSIEFYDVLGTLEEMYLDGVPIRRLKETALRADTFSSFKNIVYANMEGWMNGESEEY